MSIQHLNDVKTIARTASRIGAQFPADITTALEHLETVSSGRAGLPQPGPMAKALAVHLGDPAAMEKARKAAALELATADARAKIDAHLVETCGTRLRGMMREHTEQITRSFGAALADDLAVLTETAGRLPAWFTPEQAASLDPDLFKAWTLANNAHARISAASLALTPLYSASIDQQHTAQFPVAAANALRFTKPPKFNTPRDAYAFRDALAGRTERVQGLAGQGSTFVDGLFVPTALAHVGATFEWATPAEVGQRAEAVVARMVQREPVSA